MHVMFPSVAAGPRSWSGRETRALGLIIERNVAPLGAAPAHG